MQLLVYAGIFFVLIKGINECIRLFGRKPPVGEELNRIESKLSLALKDFVAHVVWKDKADQHEQRFAVLENQLKAQIEATDGWMRELQQELKADFKGVSEAGDARKKELEERIFEIYKLVTTLATSLGNLQGQLERIDAHVFKPGNRRV